jgi:hypothetical protein
MLKDMDPGLIHKYGNASGNYFQGPAEPRILYQ